MQPRRSQATGSCAAESRQVHPKQPLSHCLQLQMLICLRYNFSLKAPTQLLAPMSPATRGALTARPQLNVGDLAGVKLKPTANARCAQCSLCEWKSCCMHFLELLSTLSIGCLCWYKVRFTGTGMQTLVTVTTPMMIIRSIHACAFNKLKQCICVTVFNRLYLCRRMSKPVQPAKKQPWV